jgi:NADH-quinone oxidoreductase subunit H
MRARTRTILVASLLMGTAAAIIARAAESAPAPAGTAAVTLASDAPGGVAPAIEAPLTRGVARDQGGIYVERFLRWIAPAVFTAEGTWWAAAIGMLVACIAVFAFVNVFALVAVWMERKVSAHMQCRLGPMEVGPHGILQTLADGIKLFAKEDIVPRLADKVLFVIAPILVFTGIFARFVPLPFGERIVASDLDTGLFFIAAIGSVEVIGVILAGWSSNNKWSLYGTIRSATQMVSYEIPIGLSFVAVAVAAGTISMMGIVDSQKGWFVSWFCFRDPFLLVLSVIYFIAGLAECKRAPFDLPEAESELVSGFHTEYSGMRFAFFFLAEYAAMYLIAAVAVAVFFGGWWTGIPALDGIGRGAEASTLAAALGLGIKSAVFVGKAIAIVFVQMWVRWTLPRVRLDQMMYVCWKVLLPMALACLVGSALWRLVLGDRFFFGLLPIGG